MMHMIVFVLVYKPKAFPIFNTPLFRFFSDYPGNPVKNPKILLQRLRRRSYLRQNPQTLR